MSTSQFHNSSLLDRTNDHDPVHTTREALTPVDATAFNLVSSPDKQIKSEWGDCRTSFDNCNLFLNWSLSSIASQKDLPHSIDSGVSCTIEEPGTGCIEDQQQPRTRPVPYSLTVRFTNRPNGTPLATIIEKGSYSTLNSHGSLLDDSRQNPSLKINSGSTPEHNSRRPSKSLDEMALHKIQEIANQEIDEVTNTQSSLNFNLRTPDPKKNAVLPINEVLSGRQHSEIPLPQTVDNVTDSKGLRSMLLGLLQNVQNASRRSRSFSSMTNQSTSETLWERSSTRETSHQTQHGDDQIAKNHPKRRAVCNLGAADKPPPASPMPGQAAPEFVAENSEWSLTVDCNISPSIKTTRLLHLPPTAAKSEAESSSTTLMHPSHFSSLQSTCATSIPSTTRDAVQEYILSGTPTLSSRSRDDLSTRYTFDGVPIHRSNAPSLREYDRAREASFCSSVSTTYSGTVLGVDLDLQQQPITTPRSPTPVWFLPPFTVQRGGKTPEACYTHEQAPATVPVHASSHSITSSALPILLPLAAASGIVRTNYATPHLSFYSPSGNLIQAEENIQPPEESSSHKSLSALDPPARPALLPATTASTPTVPLPAHLRHQHNRHHHTHTHTIPQTVITSGIKGCDGVIRRKSLQPRSGVRRSASGPRSPNQQHQTGSRSPFNAGASCARVGRRHKRSSTVECIELGAGPTIGRTLRICFCQPWDGAGGRGSGCSGDQSSDNAQEVQDEVENVRVVKRERRDSVVE
ncbi:hypothetical protein K469DRAFT_336707 [Zopfia rhizophila CBS 207.26]|uniref:Uncharacterized protein n=1 Tax=Zopfia rhizophila CBS 207.26 TaxID=1314779 RepID=A0A6A6DFW3_9PEZI|nr:hypothetical protein K469DRAFT_336707 [Zopfia rhizophila CBS 207.26]